MSGAQGLGRGRAKAPRGYNAPLLPKYMIQIAPNTKQPSCSLSVRRAGKETIDSGCSCSVRGWSCPLPTAMAAGSGIPLGFLGAGPVRSSVLPTLLWVLCPACKHQAGSSRDSLLDVHGPQQVLLFLSLGYFHWLHWELQWMSFVGFQSLRGIIAPMTSFKVPFEVWKVTFIKLIGECLKDKRKPEESYYKWAHTVWCAAFTLRGCNSNPPKNVKRW